MASSQTILRATNNRALVRVLGGAASDTEIVVLTDLTASHEEVEEGGTPTVNIAKIVVSTNNVVTVTRGETIVASFHGSMTLDESDWVITDENTSNIQIDFVGGPGMVLLELSKVAGYVTQIQPATFGIYDNPNAVVD